MASRKIRWTIRQFYLSRADGHFRKEAEKGGKWRTNAEATFVQTAMASARTTLSPSTRAPQRLGEMLAIPTTTSVKDLHANTNKRPMVIIYPTGGWLDIFLINFRIHIYFVWFVIFSVSPESVIVPIVSSILGFPLLALLVICCLRKRAKMARWDIRYIFVFTQRGKLKEIE